MSLLLGCGDDTIQTPDMDASMETGVQDTTNVVAEKTTQEDQSAEQNSPDGSKPWSTSYLESISACLSRTLGEERATKIVKNREQFAIIMEMVKRDSMPWIMTEMDIPAVIGWEICGTDIFDQADEILSAILDILFELEIQPMGISTMGHGNIYSKKHKAVIEEKIFSRSAD